MGLTRMTNRRESPLSDLKPRRQSYRFPLRDRPVHKDAGLTREAAYARPVPPASVTDAKHYGRAGIWAPFYSTSPHVKCLHIEASGLFKQLLNISKKKSNVNSDTVTSFRSRCSGST